MNYVNEFLINHKTELDLGTQQATYLELNLITQFNGKVWSKCKPPRYKRELTPGQISLWSSI